MKIKILRFAIKEPRWRNSRKTFIRLMKIIKKKIRKLSVRGKSFATAVTAGYTSTPTREINYNGSVIIILSETDSGGMNTHRTDVSTNGF